MNVLKVLLDVLRIVQIQLEVFNVLVKMDTCYYRIKELVMVSSIIINIYLCYLLLCLNFALILLLD